MTPELQEGLWSYYGEKTGETNREELILAATQRLLQAIGAYANLSQNHGKVRYRGYITPALENILSLIDSDEYRFQKIRTVIVAALNYWESV